MQKTLSVRMEEEDYEFVKNLAEEKKEEMSKTVRELMDRGRLLYAIDCYKRGKMSLGKAAFVAGLSICEMITLLAEFGVESRLEHADYLKGLETLRKVW